MEEEGCFIVDTALSGDRLLEFIDELSFVDDRLDNKLFMHINDEWMDTMISSFKFGSGILEYLVKERMFKQIRDLIENNESTTLDSEDVYGCIMSILSICSKSHAKSPNYNEMIAIVYFIMDSNAITMLSRDQYIKIFDNMMRLKTPELQSQMAEKYFNSKYMEGKEIGDITFMALKTAISHNVHCVILDILRMMNKKTKEIKMKREKVNEMLQLMCECRCTLTLKWLEESEKSFKMFDSGQVRFQIKEYEKRISITERGNDTSWF